MGDEWLLLNADLRPDDEVEEELRATLRTSGTLKETRMTGKRIMLKSRDAKQEIDACAATLAVMRRFG